MFYGLISTPAPGPPGEIHIILTVLHADGEGTLKLKAVP